MSPTYRRFSGICGILAGVAGLLYLVLFIILKNPAAQLPALSLLAAGVLSTPIIVALYLRLRRIDEGFALWGLLLGIAGALGAAVHAAFDLTNNLHPPAAPFDYANPVDPRGFLTFLITGIAILVLSWLIVQSKALPAVLGYLGVILGLSLILLYLAYLILLNALNPVVLILIFISGILQPVWYLWLGFTFLRSDATG